MNDQPDHRALPAQKVAVVLDDDLAISLLNILAFCHEHDFIDMLITCEHVHPKIDELMEKLERRLGLDEDDEV